MRRLLSRFPMGKCNKLSHSFVLLCLSLLLDCWSLSKQCKKFNIYSTYQPSIHVFVFEFQKLSFIFMCYKVLETLTNKCWNKKLLKNDHSELNLINICHCKLYTISVSPSYANMFLPAYNISSSSSCLAYAMKTILQAAIYTKIGSSVKYFQEWEITRTSMNYWTLVVFFCHRS